SVAIGVDIHRPELSHVYDNKGLLRFRSIRDSFIVMAASENSEPNSKLLGTLYGGMDMERRVTWGDKRDGVLGFWIYELGKALLEVAQERKNERHTTKCDKIVGWDGEGNSCFVFGISVDDVGVALAIGGTYKVESEE
ncbi:hypothetical protein Ancab_021497, partial [Ancistrocladus abbreviatus]